jgi:uncharacterized protein (DUF885 family)
VPKHPEPLQLRAAGDRRRGTRGLAPVRPQGQRVHEANDEAFARAVDEVAEATSRLIASLVTSAAPKDREVEAARRRARGAKRFATA